MVRTILKPDAPIPKVLDVEIWDKAIPQPMVRHPMHLDHFSLNSSTMWAGKGGMYAGEGGQGDAAVWKGVEPLF